ncbi:MAG: type I methionyl aminopeptidase [Candidatus Staskawiczbacteria bacterium RIFOXYC1_FULL_37_43]|nr:MAG: type I methionyl aminopeptidase [Candidatus Staskawiczbacteria bacterium RIFCSPHIGHO2_01_FULL_37_17]OGZ72020.1 MAG: type I methionyl aminopeptidase [Candidatus Staskawiczbacteria bacterium RIFCSPLOWO2_01_FULL_37_19]OGZ75814.1 MAG: type I methionyl aminopeptidase [Candidatus Staskawiczbacteria bacterium RIFOXYA1_FULL_37_15]OGZ80704.1 MAG: type I methionyl aminopeptidase [Candidatus Staskawiczbacteria bacterium RIFOXYB1_FULL_38_37]OGZ82163.1 MAG: type I methionyl aminopeptidase [Candidatu
MIIIKTEDEIKIMAEAGKILANVLKEIERLVKPGIATIELDRAAEALILLRKAKPGFKGYDGFPYSLCVSVNENVVHGLPSEYILKEGDAVSLDLGVLYRGYYSDMAATVPVGKVSFEAKRLIQAAKKALKRGIKKAKAGNTVGDIGNTIQRYIESQGYGVIRDLCGHGIGKDLHEDPKIPNFGKRGEGDKLVEGMVICIEPMLSQGNWQLKKSEDGYGYSTKDGLLSAHFEHTIAITKKGPVVLTEL